MSIGQRSLLLQEFSRQMVGQTVGEKGSDSSYDTCVVKKLLFQTFDNTSYRTLLFCIFNFLCMGQVESWSAESLTSSCFVRWSVKTESWSAESLTGKI